MSAVETPSATAYTDTGGCVEITLNAKGEVQLRVKARAGEEPGQLKQAEEEAQQVFDRLKQRYRP